MSLLLSFLMLAQSTSSADVECNQEEADQGIQYAMNLCAYKDYLVADEAMNVQWKLTVVAMKVRDIELAVDEYSRLPEGAPGHFDSLLQAQRAWLTYRDAHCRGEGYISLGGSMEPLLVNGCKAHLTRIRTKQLKDLAETY